MPKKTEAPGGAESRPRRPRLTLTERLADIDSSMQAHRDALAKLQAKRDETVAAEQRRLDAMAREIAQATALKQEGLPLAE